MVKTPAPYTATCRLQQIGNALSQGGFFFFSSSDGVFMQPMTVECNDLLSPLDSSGVVVPAVLSLCNYLLHAVFLRLRPLVAYTCFPTQGGLSR